MTTIAWDGSHLAGDSRISVEGTVMPERVVKVIKGINGHLGAFAGSIDSQCDVFADGVKSGCHGDTIFPLTEAVFILSEPNGRLSELNEGESVVRIKHAGYYAWGSGKDYALGALAHGATARQAIQIAAKFDPFTGGKIHCQGLTKGSGARKNAGRS